MSAEHPRPLQRPSGRRPGESGTREAILRSARELFGEHGFAGASLRAIAADAGVDTALIRHFFGDKGGLFAATVLDRSVMPERMLAALGGDPEGIGVRITDTYLGLWEDPEIGASLTAVVRTAVTSDHAAELLRELIGSVVRKGADDRTHPRVDPEGIALVGAQLLGVAIARHVVRVGPLVSMPRERLISRLAPVVQRHLMGEPPSAAADPAMRRS